MTKKELSYAVDVPQVSYQLEMSAPYQLEMSAPLHVTTEQSFCSFFLEKTCYKLLLLPQ